MPDTRLRGEVTPEIQDDAIAGLLERAVAAGEASVLRTPELLAVLREGGEITDRIPTAQQAVASMLSGADRRTLFVATGRVLVTPEESLAQRSGMISSVRVEVPGAGMP